MWYAFLNMWYAFFKKAYHMIGTTFIPNKIQFTLITFIKTILIHLAYGKQENIIKSWNKNITKCLIGEWGSHPTDWVLSCIPLNLHSCVMWLGDQLMGSGHTTQSFGFLLNIHMNYYPKMHMSLHGLLWTDVFSYLYTDRHCLTEINILFCTVNSYQNTFLLGCVKDKHISIMWKKCQKSCTFHKVMFNSIYLSPVHHTHIREQSMSLSIGKLTLHNMTNIKNVIIKI